MNPEEEIDLTIDDEDLKKVLQEEDFQSILPPPSTDKAAQGSRSGKDQESRLGKRVRYSRCSPAGKDERESSDAVGILAPFIPKLNNFNVTRLILEYLTPVELVWRVARLSMSALGMVRSHHRFANIKFTTASFEKVQNATLRIDQQLLPISYDTSAPQHALVDCEVSGLTRQGAAIVPAQTVPQVAFFLKTTIDTSIVQEIDLSCVMVRRGMKRKFTDLLKELLGASSNSPKPPKTKKPKSSSSELKLSSTSGGFENLRRFKFPIWFCGGYESLKCLFPRAASSQETSSKMRKKKQLQVKTEAPKIFEVLHLPLIGLDHKEVTAAAPLLKPSANSNTGALQSEADAYTQELLRSEIEEKIAPKQFSETNQAITIQITDLIRTIGVSQVSKEIGFVIDSCSDLVLQEDKEDLQVEGQAMLTPSKAPSVQRGLSTLPIDQIFAENEHGLNRLHLHFISREQRQDQNRQNWQAWQNELLKLNSVPGGKWSEDRFKLKRCITAPTLSRLRRLCCLIDVQAERVFHEWMSIRLLFHEAKYLTHLEIRRSQSFGQQHQGLLYRTTNPYESLYKQLLVSFDLKSPLEANPDFKMTNLRVLHIENFLDLPILNAIIGYNSNLEVIKIQFEERQTSPTEQAKSCLRIDIDAHSHLQEIMVQDLFAWGKLLLVGTKPNSSLSVVVTDTDIQFSGPAQFQLLSLKKVVYQRTKPKHEYNLRPLIDRVPNLVVLALPSKLDHGVAHQFSSILGQEEESKDSEQSISMSLNQLFHRFSNLKQIQGHLADHFQNLLLPANLVNFTIRQDDSTHCSLQPKVLAEKLASLSLPAESKLEQLKIMSPAFCEIMFPKTPLASLRHLCVSTDLGYQLDALAKIQKYCPNLQVLIYEASFIDRASKYYQLSIKAKHLRKLRLVNRYGRHSHMLLTDQKPKNAGNEASNLKMLVVDKRCLHLTELHLVNFGLLETLQVQAEGVQAITLDRMTDRLMLIDYPAQVYSLKCFSLEILAGPGSSCQKMLERQKKWRFLEPEGGGTLGSLLKFVFLVRFDAASMPSKAGVQWVTGYSPIYFSNNIDGHILSKEITSRYFPALRSAFRADLARWDQKIERVEVYSSVPSIGIMDPDDSEIEGANEFIAAAQRELAGRVELKKKFEGGVPVLGADLPERFYDFNSSQLDIIPREAAYIKQSILEGGVLADGQTPAGSNKQGKRSAAGFYEQFPATGTTLSLVDGEVEAKTGTKERRISYSQLLLAIDKY